MKMFVDAPAIYLYPGHVDFRKSINGLALIIEQDTSHSPFDYALFVFCNRARDKVKALYWDKTGFCLWYKRLEKDFFRWPKGKQQTVQLTEEQWCWLLAGVDLAKIRTHQPLDCTLTS
ncbi:MAG: IS66 family insertion sequence element accessory protein TnpB [Plesiomonas shigelloides]